MSAPAYWHRTEGVDQRLLAVILAAWQKSQCFQIAEGLRSLESQKYLVRQGKSRTLKSRHLVGQAVDLAIIKGGKYCTDFEEYRKLNAIIQEEASRLGVRVTWGGSWKTLRDGPHWQIEP